MMNIFSLFLSLILPFQNLLPHILRPTPKTFYTNTNNEIKLVLNNADPQGIYLKVSEGHLSKLTDTLYIFRPNNAMEELKIKLYYNKVLCEIIKVNCVEPPALKFGLTKNPSNAISITKIDELSKLFVYYPDSFPYALHAEVYSFNIIIINNLGEILYHGTIHNNDLKPTIESLKIKINMGTKLIINNILTKSNDGILQRVDSSLEFKISE